MNNRIKRYISLNKVLIFLGLVALSVLTCAQQVSANEQQKMNYLIKVNRAYNTITVYEKDEKGKFTIPVRAMVCSVGAKGQTKLGTFQTKAKYRWKLLMGDVWGQYATRIVGGILFHSVYYYQNGNPGTLATKEYNKLGTPASHGCVRLTVLDAKWIYDNCDVGTTVVIYDDPKNPGPLGKPESIKIPTNVRWDPTDPSSKNPYNEKVPTITGAKNLVTDYGAELDLLSGIKAKSSLGADITSQIKLEGTVDYNQAGKYQITYTITDILGHVATKDITITVKENPVAPEIVGTSDKLVNGEVVLDREYALIGVEAYQGDKKLDSDQIEVTITEKDEDDYAITYQITASGKTATKSINVHVDREAPVITGITDYLLEKGEIPSTQYLLSGLTITDNYSAPENIVVAAVVSDNPEGGYVITYTATDEVGNTATVNAYIYN